MKTRKETLAPRPRNATNRVPMVVTYHPSLPNIGSILRELQPLLHCSEKCRKAIKDVPFMAFRRPKSLGDYLVHAKLRLSTRLQRNSKGTVLCDNRSCQDCKYLEPGERFYSYRTGKSYTINYQLDCNNSNVVYLLSCKVCHVQYVGSTATKFRLSLTIIRPVLGRIPGFLLRVETRMIFCIDIFSARDTMVLRMSVYS